MASDPMILAVITALIVVALVGLGVWSYRKAREQDADAALDKARREWAESIEAFGYRVSEPERVPKYDRVTAYRRVGEPS